MPLSRKTAIVQFELPSGATEGSLPLSTERAFNVILMIEGKTYPAQSFRSPINDEQWRDFIGKLRDCNVNHDDSGDASARAIKALTRKLYLALVALAPELREFLERVGGSRRLVIQTTRPELHLLPWAAMFDDAGQLLAAGDLSVVHSWQDFSEVSVTAGNRLQLLKVLGADTTRATANSLTGLPPEVETIDALAAFRSGQEVETIDILHLEEHGDVQLGLVGGVRSSRLAQTFQSAKMALLWSCNSGATDSWGESPALNLHRDGAGLVLSFLAELHNLDAKSISNAFYSDVFGAAASRDPETALVRIRCSKVKDEFYVANWASMTVYLRAPLDLSALALNGPRVPAAGWTREVAAAAPVSPAVVDVAVSWGDSEAKVMAIVSKLQPGTLNELELSSEPIALLPREAFQGWRGTVIRLDGARDPLSDEVLMDLNLPVERAPRTDASDRLVWFFAQVARYGSPLIVWTNAEDRHMEFLKTIRPNSSLTFLLLHNQGSPDVEQSMAALVDQSMLEEAEKLAAKLPAGSPDGELSAAYYVFARMKNPEQAQAYLGRIQSPAERLLLSGNFVSRFPQLPALAPEQMKDLIPEWTPDQPPRELTKLERQHFREDWYRRAMNAAGDDESSRREAGRAKHELGYLLQKQGQSGAAETLYRLALEDLEHSTERGIRWHSALGAVLRDWADLLSSDAARLDEARTLLARSMAIHSFHGRKLQLAYSRTTAAQIALTAGRHTDAIDHAVDAANSFEDCANWEGWNTAVGVLFDCLAETRETARMLGLAKLAVEKIESSGLGEQKTADLLRDLSFQRARALWISGDLSGAKTELDKLMANPPRADLQVQVERLGRFLRIGAAPIDAGY